MNFVMSVSEMRAVRNLHPYILFRFPVVSISLENCANLYWQLAKRATKSRVVLFYRISLRVTGYLYPLLCYPATLQNEAVIMMIFMTQIPCTVALTYSISAYDILITNNFPAVTDIQ